LNDVSVVIPSFNDGPLACALVDALPAEAECVIVESGDSAYFEHLPERVVRLRSEPGRGVQMNAGAAVAAGDVLLFLHADAAPEPAAIDQLRRLDHSIVGGCLTLRNSLDFIDDPEISIEYARRHLGFIPRPEFFWRRVWKAGSRLLELRILWRTRVQRLAYGDQGIFVRREAFEALGGYREWPVFEDRDLFERLRSLGPTRVLPARIVVTPRKSRQIGILNYARFCMQMTRKYKSTDDIEEVERYRRKIWREYLDRTGG
jgi:glycosyltransferase involved in cell wall biosynthesis